ncbi:hypothetical protein AB0N59_01965 [Microbacterium sp. NPDC089321]|uniref:hypothetical protein n=1 Tax=Microbacterium sp. NPDC089321 TaxID=3155183 RepID=UPI003416B9A2
MTLSTAITATTASTSTATHCPACGTWVCDDCGARRHYANRFSSLPQRCPRCASEKGHMQPACHRDGRMADHVESAASLIAAGSTPRYPAAV